jgi:hypothetical protein
MTTATALSTVLAHTPFIEPLPLAHRYWWLLIVPVAIGVSMAWKAVRLKSLDDYWRHVVSMAVQVILGVAGIAVGLYVLIILVLPHLPAE